VIEKSIKAPFLVDTESTPKPGSFQIGSAQSRAAARMLAASRQDMRRQIEIGINFILPPMDGDAKPIDPVRPWIGAWNDCGDTLIRFRYTPTV
jgi:hypothetical protein